AIRHANIPQLVDVLEDVARRGRDPRAVLESMMYRLQDLTRAAYVVEAGASGDATREASLFGTAAHVGRENLLWLRGAISEAHKAIRDVTLPRIWLEAELIRIANRPQAVPAAPAVQHQPAASEKPAVRREVKSEPAKEPMAAKPEVPEAKAEVAAVVAIPITGPESVWRAAVADLPPGTPIAIRLSDTTVIGLEEGVLRIGVKRQTDQLWLTEKPQRQAHVVQLVNKHSGQQWSVQFEVDKNGPRPMIAEPEAVELPVEGEPLYKLASEILGHNGNSK
ncbi:MAG TPA: hypothetical protein VG820_05175, partial [Fimbriimonadaceae bacterium]|nr:hypothetical protein [Fimbriimonadaceae bacterium]